MPAKKKSASKSRGARKPAKRAPARKAAKKAAKRPAAKKKAPARKAAKKAPAKKRTPNAAFMRPMTPSAQLGLVVGTAAIPRSEVTKRVWNYIKSKGLQDKANKRMINADDKLGPVFGGKKQVSMFEMTKLVNKHLK
jgi:chromatin remodeling complex protein RSC6